MRGRGGESQQFYTSFHFKNVSAFSLPPSPSTAYTTRNLLRIVTSDLQVPVISKPAFASPSVPSLILLTAVQGKN